MRVDVIVTDRQGNPVTDLKLEDFEIQEDGKPQKPETFRLIKIDTTTQPSYTQRALRTRNDEETAAADENSRIFAFFLDDYHVMRESSMVMRKPVVEFIANQLAPSDLATVMYPLTPVDAAVLTRNHQGIINAVEKFEGRKYNYEPINAVENGYVYKLTPDAIEIIRRQVTLSAIRGLCTKLGSLREGRKSLILLSEGFNATLPPQMRSNLPGGVAGVSGVGGGTRDPFAGDNNTMEDRVQFSAGMDMQRELQDVWDACNRNNTAIYAVDPRGLATGAFDISVNISQSTSQSYLNASLDTLRELADNTDGRAIVNRNDLAAGMKQIIKDSSAYYLVGYNSTLAPTDGKFHSIKVRVKRSGRPGQASPGVLGVYRGGRQARGGGTEARAARGNYQGAGHARADDQSPLHPHLDRQRQGAGRADARHAVVGAAAADAGREARRAAAGHRARDRGVRRHRLSRESADGAGGSRQRRHHSLPGAAGQARDAVDDRRRRHRHARHRRSRSGDPRSVGARSDSQHAEGLVRAQRARVHVADHRPAAARRRRFASSAAPIACWCVWMPTRPRMRRPP